MKKIVSVVLSLLFVFGVTSCAKKNSGSSQTVTVIFDTNYKPIMSPLIAQFERANPEIKVNALYSGDQDSMISAGQAPDLLRLGDLDMPAMEDIIEPLDSYIERDKYDLTDFYEKAIEAMKVNGKILGLPFSMNVSLLYYNKDLFDAAGMAYPSAEWTYDDFEFAARQLTVKDGRGKITQWGCTTVGGWWGEWLTYVRANGGDWMNSDNTACILDSEAAAKGLQFYYNKCTGQNRYAPGPKDVQESFAGGKAAMEIGGHTGYWTSYNSLPNLNWDVQVLPRDPESVTDGGEMAFPTYSISKTSVNKEGAWKFLQFITGRETGEKLLSLSILAARKSVASVALNTPEAQRKNPKNMEAVYAAVETGMTLPKNIYWRRAQNEYVQPIVDKYLEGGAPYNGDAKKAVAAMQKAANDFLALQLGQ